VYVCTACMAMVIFVSPSVVEVPSGPFSRDALAYLVAVSFTAEAILDSNFELHEALILVAWYACYLAVVFKGDQLVPSVFGASRDEGKPQAVESRAGSLEETEEAADMGVWMKTRWEPTAVVLALSMPPMEVRRRDHLLVSCGGPTAASYNPYGLESRHSKAEPRRQQDWILKCLQGGRARPLAACGVGDAIDN
jgi:hypothetical protein